LRGYYKLQTFGNKVIQKIYSLKNYGVNEQLVVLLKKKYMIYARHLILLGY